MNALRQSAFCPICIFSVALRVLSTASATSNTYPAIMRKIRDLYWMCTDGNGPFIGNRFDLSAWVGAIALSG
jgi:hypothetical protein